MYVCFETQLTKIKQLLKLLFDPLRRSVHVTSKLKNADFGARTSCTTVGAMAGIKGFAKGLAKGKAKMGKEGQKGEKGRKGMCKQGEAISMDEKGMGKQGKGQKGGKGDKGPAAGWQGRHQEQEHSLLSAAGTCVLSPQLLPHVPCHLSSI